ncbi:MAG: photosystem P840 reaction-center cytochrome c-551 [Chlorobiaceae bacterium]
MDNKSNGKLLALAAGGALLMGSFFFGLSFLTGYEVPAPNISAILTPLKSFAGWIALICFASLVIMGLGKMSARISDKWFLSFPLTIIIIVAAMFSSLWLMPNGIVRGKTESGRTTLKDGTYIRSVDEWTAFLAKPVFSPNVPLAPAGFDFNAAKALWEQRCNKCHTQASTMDVLRTKYKKTGKIDVIVNRMQSQPGSGITPEEATQIMQYLNEKL